MSSALIEATTAYLDAKGHGDGRHATEIGALTLFRACGPRELIPDRHEPAFCIIAQGAKQALIGDGVYDYSAMQYLLVSVGVPHVGRITLAAPDAPYLSLVLEIDIPLLREVVDQLDDPPEVPAGPGPGVFVGDLGPAAIDCGLRLLRLLATPKAIPVVYPAIARELYYWLLTGPHGPAFAGLALPGGHAHRVARAIRAIRDEFPRAVPSARLAAVAEMSPSSFHEHFKALTSMSPLQYRKRLRLLEARRLMMTRSANAADAARQVGYESPSQFNREYARMFGAPPRRDVAGLR